MGYIQKRDGRFRAARARYLRLGAKPPDQIENWLNDELEAGIAASSVHRHYRTLRRSDPPNVVKPHLDESPTVVPPAATGRLQATQGGSIDCLVLTPAFRSGTIFGPPDGVYGHLFAGIQEDLNPIP